METEKAQGFRTALEKLARELPAVMKDFHRLHEAVISDGALPVIEVIPVFTNSL